MGELRSGPGLDRRDLLAFGLGLAAAAVAVELWRARDAARGVVRDRLGAWRVRQHADSLRAAGAESGLDPYLLAGVMIAESSGREDAVSSVDALGLFQLRLETAREVAEWLGLPPPSRRALLRDGALNARLGARYLAHLVERQEGSVERALMAYNTGPTRFQRWLDDAGGYAAWRAARDAEGAPGPGSVRTYAAKVLRLAERFRGLGLLEPPAPPAAGSS